MNAGPIGAAGGLAANRLARDADLVIAIGTRLGDFVTASRTAFQDPGVAFIGINVGGMDAAKQRALPMVADARAALDALTAALEAADWQGTAPAYRERIAAEKAEWDRGGRSPPRGHGRHRRRRRHPRPARDHRHRQRRRRRARDGDLRGGQPAGRPPEAVAPRGPQGVPPRVRLLVHGLRDRRGARRAARGSRAPRRRHGRGRLVPDAQLRDRHGGRRTAAADRRRARQPRLPVHPRPRARPRRPRLRQRAAVPRSRHPSAHRRLHPRRLPAARRVDGRRRRERRHARARSAPRSPGRAAATGPRSSSCPTSPAGRVPGMEGWWDVPVAEVSGQDNVHEARDRYEHSLALQRRDLL